MPPFDLFNLRDLPEWLHVLSYLFVATILAIVFYIVVSVVSALTYRKPAPPCGTSGLKYVRIIGHGAGKFSLVGVCNNGNYIIHTETPSS